MDYSIRFAHPYIIFLLPVLAAIAWYRWYYYKKTSFSYPVTSVLSKQYKSNAIYDYFFFFLRAFFLVCLCLLCAQPQLVDTNSRIQVEGIDIVLGLDVSGSMLFFDDVNDPKPRIDIAKQEALRFVQKRESDPIGLVLFGRVAVSRCPLTLDKRIVKDIINTLHIGVIPEDGTVLAKGIIVAASRLKHSKAKSKIIILLTDGEPSQEDSSSDQAIEIARQLGIKIYTIGIGDSQGGYFNHPQFGVIPCGSNLNRELLQKIATTTGAKYFEAKNQKELRLIYDYIDRLEKTEYEETIFSRYNDIFIPFVWLLIGLLFVELLISIFVWFIL